VSSLPRLYLRRDLFRKHGEAVTKFVKAHPLAAVLGAAAAVRLVAVIWSQGFIHSDDYFDTVQVAYSWLVDGFWGEDGFLRWKNKLSPTIGRFPLCNLGLWALMKSCVAVGIQSLNEMMYLVRMVHAMLSLISVWVTFRVTRMVSGLNRWAMLGGLMAGLHFATPFLGVRNLIEVVGGEVWMLVILMFYLYRRDGRSRWIWLAGLATGLAWMIRFQVAFAALPVPFVLWYEENRLRPALQFVTAVAVMLVLSGLVDLALLGTFAGSTIANLRMNVSLPALYNTIPLLYLAILALYFIPPFSFLLAYLVVRPAFVARHRLLAFSSLSFLAFHMLQDNQQERFIFPILPAVMLAAVLAMWEKHRRDGYIIRPRRLLVGTAIFAGMVNLALLLPATVAYGHRGLIEPLKWFERRDPGAVVAFVQPGIKRWVSIEYGGRDLSRRYIREWSDWAALRGDDPGCRSIDYFVLYPKQPSDLATLLDSVSAASGPMELVFHQAPSWYDRALHRMNPDHNDLFEAFVYRRRGDG